MFYEIGGYVSNKYYDELKNLSAPIRRATLFKHTVEEMGLRINKTDLFAGWHGFPTDELKPEKVLEFEKVPSFTPEQETLSNHLRDDLKMHIAFTEAHTLINYGKIVSEGLATYIKKVEAELEKYPDDEYLLAMDICLSAVGIYAERFKRIAEEQLSNCDDENDKKRLGNIISALSNVPLNPARNFLEGVQSVWIMHTLIAVSEQGFGSISIGRIDQYLHPLYEKFLNEGGTEDEARAILKQLFLLLDSYGDGACAMNIGGLSKDGKDMINSLSLLLIKVEKEMSLRAPIFAVRVHPDFPDEVLDDLIDFDLFKIGQPTFYGELPCRKAVAKRGVDESEAIEFSANSCMGLILSGSEFSDMWGIRFNSQIPLELAVNGGKPFGNPLLFDLKTVPFSNGSFDELVDKYGEYFKEVFDLCADTYCRFANGSALNRPNPLLSAMTDGCVKARADRSVACKYNTVTVETLGLVNACDGLLAIKELVFEKKKYTIADFIAAAKSNYEGYEDMQHDILKCKKYGMNDPEANALIKRVADMISCACRSRYEGNRTYLPSLHTIDANVFYGRIIPATLDGRKKGEPLNKNANPALQLKSREHTSVVLSATALDQTDFSGGQPIDLYFDKSWFKDKASRDKIKALIHTYFEMGGLQFQVNSIDLELLEKAYLEPEKYPDVIVRKGGYSVRFNEMSQAARAEFIESAKKHQ